MIRLDSPDHTKVSFTAEVFDAEPVDLDGDGDGDGDGDNVVAHTYNVSILWND